MSRRDALRTSAAMAAAASASISEVRGAVPAGRLKQAAARWCYKDIPLEKLAAAAAEMGIQGIDLLGPEDWPVVQKAGLICSMAWGAGSIPEGFNRKENHDKLLQQYRDLIPKAAAAGLPNMIAFSGNRRGMPDQEGLENCVLGLQRLKELAEEHGVTICLELLNSKVDHKDYMCDRTAWAVEVARRVNSPRVKLLYDIYHMQIMEGDIIRTLRANMQWIGHIHTGGVPGRHELDETQELNWAGIARAIADAGYSGYVSHEFVPVRDPLTSLREAVSVCTV